MAATVLDMIEPLEARVARLESDVAHIRSDVADIKIDLRHMRGEISNLSTRTQDGFTAVRAETQDGLAELRLELNKRDRIFLGSAFMLLAALGVLLAHAFGWVH